MGARYGDGSSSAHHTASGLAEGASSAAASVRDTAVSAGESLAHGVSSVADTSSRALASAGHVVAEAPGRLQEAGADLVERHPLVVGAAALALGAAIGASLPRTEFEDRQLGETSEKAKEALSAQGEHLMERAEEVVSKVGDAARREADRQGLMPKGEAGEPTIAERVEKVGREAAKVAREEMGRETDSPSPTSKPSP
jgi:hypothetical protein